ncbi:MAG: CDP-alcohol phosphatidyltransferase family protein [bacterium]
MKIRDPEKLFPHDKLLRPFLVLVPQKVKPNHVTSFRMIMTPVVLWFLFFEQWPIGVPLFIFVSFTDALDGTLARCRKQITNWGTFYDPVADKLLIGSVVILIVTKYVNPILALAIITIEFLIAGGGWYRYQKGKVAHANVWGKVKMFLEFSGVLFLLTALWLGVDLFVDISQGTLALAVIFAIVSLLTYSL